MKACHVCLHNWHYCYTLDSSRSRWQVRWERAARCPRCTSQAIANHSATCWSTCLLFSLKKKEIAFKGTLMKNLFLMDQYVPLGDTHYVFRISKYVYHNNEFEIFCIFKHLYRKLTRLHQKSANIFWSLREMFR